MGFQRSTFYLLSAVILSGTLYSIIYSTFLDTSDPLLTHLPHPLGDTHYFASKKNWLNTLFIKKAWGWTSAAFLFTWLTSLNTTTSTGRSTYAKPKLLLTYITLTALWILFTNWFFGPALFDRVVLASGGQCVLPGPQGTPLVVPNEFCFSHTAISAASHPQLFQSFFSADGLVEPFVCPASSPECVQNIRGVPRLRKGHDVSGHLFLLTMSVLLLSKQLQVSFTSESRRSWSTLHTTAVAIQGALLTLWLLASATTSVYFHSPFEKLSGFGTPCFSD